MDDLISRQAAIIAIKTRQWLIEGAKEALADQLERLPSAQPEKRTEERTEKHACDCISRAEAIDVLSVGKELLSRVLDDIDVVGTDREKYSWGLGLIESYIKDIEELPSAQLERKTGQWLQEIGAYFGGYPRFRYHCSVCGNIEEHVYADSKCANYCPNCGARMEGEIE